MNSLSITTHELPGVAQRVFRKQDIDSQVAQGMQILRGGFWEPRSDLACYDLCVRCSSIPWSGIHIAKIEKTYHMFEMAKTREDLRTSACPSCRLFGSSLPNFDVWSLRIPSIDETRLLWERVNPSHPAKRSRNRGYLEFGGKDDKDWMPSSLKVLHKDEAYFVNTASGDNPSFVASKGLIETSKVKAWIRECTSTHTNCRPRPCNGLKSLKVIDCYDASVVLAPESCQFVALSYVWGQPTVKTTPIDKPQFPTLPDILPRTVEDSIKVTKMLGYRYLWVDRYCIDQHNSEDQHRQINQMGAIYSSAQITLIAAAGRDATYGLPGISKTFRYPEVCPVTESLCLVSAPRSVTHSVCASTWLSRAWTLQEGYLSKRRLFFVEHGIEYICDQYLQTGKRLWTPIASELTASLPSKIDHWDRASHMMRQFTGRSLTYEDDALNAIIGALETLESIDHTEGVIIQLSNSSDISSIYMALDWYHNLPCPRRKRFPSWSPLGWQGKIDYLGYKASISSDCSLEVWHDGEMRHVSHAFGKLSEGHRSPRPAGARLLRLSTTVVMLDFEYLDHDSSVPAGLYVKVPYAPELDLFVLPLWDAENVQDMQEDSLQLPCAVATRRGTLTDTTWRCEQESQILIMRQFGTHYERIGCFNLHWGYRTIYARDKQGRIFLLDFAYGNPLVEYGDGTFWKKHGEERTFLLG